MIESSLQESPSALKSHKILIADDDDQIRQMLCDFLSDEGYEIVEASDGKKAIEYMSEHGADLVITDIIMPNQEGVETIRILRDKFPDTKIIAISGGGRAGPDTFLPMAEGEGANCTFEKPFKLFELLKAVQTLVGE